MIGLCKGTFTPKDQERLYPLGGDGMVNEEGVLRSMNNDVFNGKRKGTLDTVEESSGPLEYSVRLWMENTDLGP